MGKTPQTNLFEQEEHTEETSGRVPRERDPSHTADRHAIDQHDINTDDLYHKIIHRMWTNMKQMDPGGSQAVAKWLKQMEPVTHFRLATMWFLLCQIQNATTRVMAMCSRTDASAMSLSAWLPFSLATTLTHVFAASRWQHVSSYFPSMCILASL